MVKKSLYQIKSVLSTQIYKNINPIQKPMFKPIEHTSTKSLVKLGGSNVIISGSTIL